MIQHIVMLNVRPDTSETDLRTVMDGLRDLGPSIPGFLSFQHGPNRDFEQKSLDYPYGFVCTFADKDALKTYADNPTHQQLGAALVALCNGGADGIWVADIEVI